MKEQYATGFLQQYNHQHYAYTPGDMTFFSQGQQSYLKYF